MTVSPDQVVIATKERRAKFFDALTATPRTFAALRERTRRYSWFGDVLVAYLRIINDRLEEFEPDLDDGQFLGFCNWLLLQGHDAIQRFLDSSVEDWKSANGYTTEGGHLHTADAFWYKV